MKITDKRNRKYTFSDIERGRCFEWEASPCLRLDARIDNTINAVGFDGTVHGFKGNQIVTPINAELVIHE